MKTKYRKINTIVYYSIVGIICCIMLFYISKKEGFHEDEIFSYGSSNFAYDNVFQPYGKKDAVNQMMDKITKDHVFENATYYITNPSEFMKELEEIQKKQIPVWKTSKEAKEYASVESTEILNFFSIYYNQSRDAHPPLFYFLVHIISSIFSGSFSKYFIFLLNIVAFIGSSILLKKILKILHKNYLAIPLILLYGLNIGAISTVLFQRMYAILTFFIVYEVYINLKIIKNKWKLTKELKIELGVVTLLGFLTQYYFCIFALFVFCIQFIQIYRHREKKEVKKFIFYYLKIALLGILIFPASIYHIFFSYRGVSALQGSTIGIIDFLNLTFGSYGVNFIVGSILLIGIVGVICLKNRHQVMTLLVIPTIGFLLVISKISPYLDLRYVMGILPILALIFILTFDFIFKHKKKYAILVLTVCILAFSVFNLINKKPYYLYEGYEKNIEIAKQNHSSKFVYIEDNSFNHIQSIPEFIEYDKSLILNANKGELQYLEKNEEIKNETEFIVSIKKYMDVEKIVKEVLEYSKYTKYEKMLDGKNDTGNVLYKIIK